ncbi:MetQ/NlpA family ABC transporter substrate-binding protein [Methylobacterium nonmethylotrophicum]|uniref:MetQ/NlpA family ABC transporter substrate-binding protein n=1 Tax=Methylobacterium nonmethylotrophicum TaxID=1141884 RepID=A0A4Z0NUB6_9HYPH|nr:MetQ/NlpA family ABC transporter substrate-binding protein [Methylobacterium nonmethylotrophicum]TGE01124.1 MetQ/NlpA family ABC transporter substrate-binding protein [Methylobacterium nonmethylotrophicum]
MLTSSRRALLAAALVLASAAAAPAQTIRVGVTAGPHAEVLDVVRKVAASRGLDVAVVEFTDYVIPNQALAAGDLDANAFQHEPYLRNQVAKTGWRVVKVATTTASPQGIYSKRFKRIEDLPAGATIAIQNDPSNGARSLQILHANGVITLKDPASITATIADIAGNPKRFRFVELDAAQLARALDDVDAASINNNYAIQAGLSPVTDPLIREPVEGPWVNIIAVREADRDKPWVRILVEAYRSQPVKDFILARFKGAYVPTW